MEYNKILYNWLCLSLKDQHTNETRQKRRKRNNHKIENEKKREIIGDRDLDEELNYFQKKQNKKTDLEDV